LNQKIYRAIHEQKVLEKRTALEFFKNIQVILVLFSGSGVLLSST
jgi:hypothetical protein